MQKSPASPDDPQSIENVRWVTSPAAQPWLDRASSSSQPLTAQVAQLRAELTPAQTHQILAQVELREKARAKFSNAEKMFFTPRALEQASDEIVAAYKAARFSQAPRRFDLCCGIGGDLIALALGGEAVGVDRDPIMALLAETNARRLLETSPSAAAQNHAPKVLQLDVESLDLDACDAWHIDPDRRSSGRRTTCVDLHSPPAEAIERMLAQNSHAAIKLAPAAQMPPAWSERAELEWISRARECRQLVAWFGSLAHEPSRRRATVLGKTAGESRSLVGAPQPDPPPAERLERYLFEPDAAVLAAKLGGTLANEHQLAAITPGIAYWTGPRPIVDAALGCFEILEVLPLRLKPLKALLRARGIGRLEIKKRGVDQDPAKLRSQLDLAGENAATLLLTRIEKRTTAILARRLVPDER